MSKPRTTRAAVVALLLALIPLAVPTATATAATTTKVKLCNYSADYEVKAVFPDNAMLSALSPTVPNDGTCATISVSTGQWYQLRYTEKQTKRYRTSAQFQARGATTLVQAWGTFAQPAPAFFYS
ncbi:hypothetical protein ACIGNX_22440 [Actinosynnema sp. NPDC053489]|uniref:hypothetical protein n=1 Tax=Actinosynnema sp. NPDC053489 TaxID=3363916 RepID=UPI0037C65547